MDPMNRRVREERYASERLNDSDPLTGTRPGGHRSGSSNPGATALDAVMDEQAQFFGAGSDQTTTGGMYDTTPQDTMSQQDSDSTDEPSGAGQLKEKASGIAGQAGQKADVGIQKSADGLKKAAEKARSVSEDRAGTVGSIGTQAADVLDKGAGYLGQGDTEQMIQDLESLVRKRPVESLLVAAGVGLVVSRAMR